MNSLIDRIFRLFVKKKLSLLVSKEGFAIVEEEKEQEFVAWNSIQRVIAFKRDLINVDSICFRIVMLNSKGSIQYCEICEETQGFNMLVEGFQGYLMGFDKDWWAKVAKPAFKTNNVTIYER